MPRGPLNVKVNLEVGGNGEVALKKITYAAKENKDAIKALGKEADKAAQGGFKNLAGAYNALIVAGRFKDLFTRGMKPAIEMEEAMSRLTVTTRVNKKEQKELARAARDAAATTPFNPAEALDAATTMQLATRKVDRSVAGLIPTLQLSSTYLGGDFNRAANVASDILRAFQFNARDTNFALSLLASSSHFTGTKVEDMTNGIRKFGIIASIAGTDFADVLRVFTLAQASFRNAEANMTGLQRVVQRFSDPKIGGAIEKFLGVGIIDASTGRMRKLSNIMVDLAGAAESNKDQWAMFVDIMSKSAEARAVKPIIAAVNTMRAQRREGESFNDFMKRFIKYQVENEDWLTRMAGESMAPLSKQITILNDNIFKLLDAALSPMIFVIKPLVSALQAFAGAISYVLKDLGFASTLLNILSGGFLSFLAVALAAKSVAMGFVAVQSILTMATTWLTEQTHALAASQLEEAAAAGVADKMNTRLGRTMVGLRVITRSLKTAFSSMWKAVTGPMGIVMALMGGITWLFGYLRKDSNTAAQDLVKKQKSMLLAQQATARAGFTKQNRGLNSLTQSINHFDKAVKNWKTVVESKLPMLSGKGLANVGTYLERTIREYGVQGSAASRLRYELETVKQIYSKGGRATLEELDQAQFSLTALGLVLKGAYPESENLAKSIKSVAENLGNARDNSGDMATALIHYNVGTQRYKQSLLEAMKATQGHIDQLVAEGKVDKAHMDLMTQSGMWSLMPDEKTPWGRAELEKIAEWKQQMADTQSMIGEQTEGWKKLRAELDMFMKINLGGRGELMKQLGKGKLTPRERREEEAWFRLKQDGPTVAAAAAAGGGGAAGGAGMAAAKSSPNQNIATVATNTTETVKELKKLNRTLKDMKPGSSPESPPTPGRERPPVKRFVPLRDNPSFGMRY